MIENTHIIHRVNLEIDVPDMQTANRLKDDALRMLNNEILPQLEKYMDKLEIQDKYFQFDHLDINLENFTEEKFETEFAGMTIKTFQKEIENELNVPSSHSRNPDKENMAVNYSREQLTLKSFIFFLVTGRLPWWSAKSGELLNEQNLSVVLSNSVSEYRKQIENLVRTNKVAFSRLINQFTIPFIFKVVKIHNLFTENQLIHEILQTLYDIMDKEIVADSDLSNQILLNIKEIVLQIISEEKLPPINRLQDIVTELKSAKHLSYKFDWDEILYEFQITRENALAQQATEINETNNEQGNKLKEAQHESFEEIDEEGIFVNNAGLILLHPFLESFFNDFELLKNEQFRDMNSRAIAVHLLHYLATKEEFAAEYDLFLEKFLCQWDEDLPIARNVVLTREMKEECETLLQAAITHWNILKRTSPDGLREGFIQREGKLILNDSQNRLIIENKSLDVLLSYLPWGFSVVKLPWMKEALYVEWQ